MYDKLVANFAGAPTATGTIIRRYGSWSKAKQIAGVI
jgi:hypothetical protein